MTTKCAIWLRVSTDHQEASNQIPDTERLAAHRGYEIAATYLTSDAGSTATYWTATLFSYMSTPQTSWSGAASTGGLQITAQCAPGWRRPSIFPASLTPPRRMRSALGPS
jgi:hypothetical protein